ncbi:hypothetical protein [Tsukamurella spumae]|uniref:Uncharacterized protein n=1 Tax=Tsukamurella spumae TaxID=44753 RepID=A0A846WY62_9ACTN|nr:hypothetical protein [Tsukamurella spumae]NKY17296.1 hypothetical protein [Tsukamurella spumae]
MSAPSSPYPPPHPPPHPPPRRGPGLWWAVGGAVALVLVVAVVAAVLLVRSPGRGPSPSTTVAAPSTSRAGSGGCGVPGPGSTVPVTDRVVSGPLSFPVSAAPGWSPQRYQLFAPGAQTAGLRQQVPGHLWDTHAEIGQTTFAPKVSVRDAARRIIPCIVASSRYDSYRPRLEALTEPEAITVDGVPAARVTGRILVSRAGLDIAGDVLTVVVIASAPQTYFQSDSPIGDAALAAVVQNIFDHLKVARDV